MSNRYRITFNLATVDREIADVAASDVARMIDEKCIVERTFSHTHLGGGISRVAVQFLAANDAEAADLVARTQRLTGLPPMDSAAWRRLKIDA